MAKETWVLLDEIGRIEGRVFVFTERLYPENFEDMGTFIANVCAEYKDHINPDAGNSNVLVGINYMHNKNDVRDYVKENYPNARLYEIGYRYNFDSNGRYEDKAKGISLNTRSAYDEFDEDDAYPKD